MRLLLLFVGIVVLATFSVNAKTIRPAEYVAMSEHNKAAVHQQEVNNRAAYDANRNPLADGGLEALASPYDIADAFYDTNGYMLPGWAGSFFGSGGGGDMSFGE